MIRRDYLLTQIQELGRFLRRLTELLTKKSAGSSETADMEVYKNEFRDKCGFDMDLLETPDFEKLEPMLLSQSAYNGETMELLADFVVLWTETNHHMPLSQVVRMRNNALKIYELIDKTEKTWSLERNRKISDLRIILEGDSIG